VGLRVGEAGDGAGDTRSQIADQRAAGNDVALGVEVHVTGGSSGSLLAVVEEVGAAVLVADEHEAASAEIAGEGVGDGEGEADGHSCVHGVAALFEDGNADVACVVLNAGDHGVLGANGLEAGLLGEEGSGGE